MMSYQSVVGGAGRMARSVLIAMVIGAALLLQAAPSAGAQQPAAPAASQTQSPQPVADDVRSVLSQFGTFVQHQTYGEVWIPSVTPPGWHPYPACHWVNTRQYGWYYDDKTPWGAIVHHYGRWTWDVNVGWFWVPGAEFSPGWVIWRTSLQWVGWAPMPPDEDIENASPARYNDADYWIFIETAKFSRGCDETIVVAGQPTIALVQQTVFIREYDFVGGILVFVLPPYIVGPIIDINIGFAPWPGWFFAQVLIDWNWMWNNVSVIVNVSNPGCPPVSPAKKDPSSPPLPIPIVGPPTLPPVLCANGALPNAYGLCPTPITNPCGPGTVAKGPFCLPVETPTCGPGKTATRTTGGGTLCVPARTGCGTGQHLNALGQCVADTPTCGPGMTAGPNGCTPIVVRVPDCGANARRVGDRCIPTGPTGGIPIDHPVIKPIDGCIGSGCVLRHPTTPSTPPSRTPPVNKLPDLKVSGGNTGGPFVIGRGSGGHNVYTPTLSTSGGTSGKTATVRSVPNRSSAPPIMHGMPNMTQIK
jgi:hypothetical protein